MFKGIEFFKGKSRGEGSGLLRCCTPRNDLCSVGRSMIEMLGVLAIVGVLSVGGIAGYSKAMEKFKVNRAIEEYSYLIHGLIEYHNDIVKMENKSGLADLSEQLNLLPAT